MKAARWDSTEKSTRLLHVSQAGRPHRTVYDIPGKKMLAWTFNNYLGLANHPEVRKTDAAAAERWDSLIQWGPE